MKITASKKTIVILSISFLLLLLGVFVFVYKDVIRNGFKYGRWFVLDKHEGEFIDCMEYKEEENEINAICQGFLLETEEKDASKSRGKLCKEFYIVYKDYQGWQKFSPCLNKEDFIYKDILTKPNHYIPVNIHIHYTKVNPFKYKLDNITLEDMGDEDLYVEILSKNMGTQNIMEKGLVATQDDINYEKDGFLPVRGGIMEKYPYITYFKTLNLKKIGVVDNKIRLLFTGELKNKSISMEVFSTSFLLSYYDENKRHNTVFINTKNYKRVKVGTNYQTHFLSLSNQEEDKLDEIISNCSEDFNAEEPWHHIVCDAGEEKIRNSIISDRYNYINTLLDKNSEQIQPEKFIFYSIFMLEK